MSATITFADYVFGVTVPDPRIVIAVSIASSVSGMVSHWFKKRVRDKV